jgi:hypothetical protein
MAPSIKQAVVAKLQGNLRDRFICVTALSIRYAYPHRRSHNMMAFLFSSKISTRVFGDCVT